MKLTLCDSHLSDCEACANADTALPPDCVPWTARRAKSQADSCLILIWLALLVGNGLLWWGLVRLIVWIWRLLT